MTKPSGRVGGTWHSVVAVLTATALCIAMAAVLLHLRWVLFGGFTVAVLGVAAYGLGWMASGHAETKRGATEGPRARLMGVALVLFAAVMEGVLLFILPRLPSGW